MTFTRRREFRAAGTGGPPVRRQHSAATVFWPLTCPIIYTHTHIHMLTIPPLSTFPTFQVVYQLDSTRVNAPAVKTKTFFFSSSKLLGIFCLARRLRSSVTEVANPRRKCTCIHSIFYLSSNNASVIVIPWEDYCNVCCGINFGIICKSVQISNEIPMGGRRI